MTAPRQLNIHDKIRAAVTAILRSHLEIDLSYLDRWDLAEKSTNCVAGSRAEVVHRIGRFQHLLKTGISVNTVKAYFQCFGQFQQMLKSGQTMKVPRRLPPPLAAGMRVYLTVPQNAAQHAAIVDHLNWAISTTVLWWLIAFWEIRSTRLSKPLNSAFVAVVLLALMRLGVTGWKGGDLVFQHGVGVVSMASSSELHNHHLGLASLADHDFVFASPYMQADLSSPREVFSSYSRLLSNADRAVAMGARSLVHGGRLRST